MLIKIMTDGQIKYLVVAVVCVVLVSATLMLRPTNSMVHAPLSEDGYYALTVARNVAMGKGFTIDGEHKTNGVQPLWILLGIPAYLLTNGDRYLSLRYILFIHWLLYIGTGLILGLISRDLFPSDDQRRRPMALFTVLVYLCSSYAFINHFNGLETGCILFMYCLAWRYYQVKTTNTIPQALLFGLILGMVVLARIDSIFFVAYIILFDLFDHRRSRRRMCQMFIAMATCLTVSLPWWYYNVKYFGSLMPTSGASQQRFAFSFERVVPALNQCLKIIVPYGSQGLMETFGQLSLSDATHRCIIVVIVPFLVWHGIKRLLGNKMDDKHRASLQRVILYATAFFASVLTLVIWYTLSTFAWYFYGRYFAPALPIVAICLALILVRFSTSENLYRQEIQLGTIIFFAGLLLIKNFVAAAWAQHGFYSDVDLLFSCLFKILGLVAIGCALLRPQKVTSFCNRYVRQPLRARLLSFGLATVLIVSLGRLIFACWQVNISKDWERSIFYSEQLALVRQYVADEAAVGAFQSGTLGYFRDRIVNLDGKVNYEALLQKDDLRGYLRRHGIVWFCDWHATAVKVLGDPPSAHGWVLVESRGRPHLTAYTFELYNGQNVIDYQ